MKLGIKLPSLSKLPKMPNLPHLPKLPVLNFGFFGKIFLFLFKHKLVIVILVILIAFATVAMIYRSNFIAKMKASQNVNSDEIYNSSKSNLPVPTIAFPTPTITQQNSNFNYYQNIEMPTPLPTFAPLPTLAPIPTIVPITTSSNTSNSSGNPHCTTGSGTPNSWYSDVYPNPPITTGNGQITLLVYIRDCNQNNAPVSDNLTVTLTSTDSTAQINGSSSPVNIQTQNGYASFSVSSQQNITDTFTIQDTSSNFAVTDINNHNPSVTFSGNGSNNSHCTTANGTPNFWYSTVSPDSPVSANTGSSTTFNVNIKDCSKNNVSSDNLTITQTSSDSSFTINGSSSPVTIQASGGQASFSVNSQNAGTDTFTVHDDTSGFTVTDNNNHSQTVNFSGSSSSPTPTPTPGPTDTPTPAPTDTPVPSPTGQQ